MRRGFAPHRILSLNHSYDSANQVAADSHLVNFLDFHKACGVDSSTVDIFCPLSPSAKSDKKFEPIVLSRGLRLEAVALCFFPSTSGLIYDWRTFVISCNPSAEICEPCPFPQSRLLNGSRETSYRSYWLSCEPLVAF